MALILAFLPLIVASLTIDDSSLDGIALLLVSLGLIIVSIALYTIIYKSINYEYFDKLLKQSEFSPKDTKRAKVVNIVASIFCPCIALLYLLLSFLSNGWDWTWLIWVIVCISFGIFSNIMNIKEEEES